MDKTMANKIYREALENHNTGKNIPLYFAKKTPKFALGRGKFQ